MKRSLLKRFFSKIFNRRNGRRLAWFYLLVAPLVGLSLNAALQACPTAGDIARPFALPEYLPWVWTHYLGVLAYWATGQRLGAVTASAGQGHGGPDRVSFRRPGRWSQLWWVDRLCQIWLVLGLVGALLAALQLGFLPILGAMLLLSVVGTPTGLLVFPPLTAPLVIAFLFLKRLSQLTDAAEARRPPKTLGSEPESIPDSVRDKLLGGLGGALLVLPFLHWMVSQGHGALGAFRRVCNDLNVPGGLGVPTNLLGTLQQPPKMSGHYLCTVAAQGYPGLVKPLRTGRRHGQPIVVNRQLCIANAFEDLLHERTPRLGRHLRCVYDRLARPVCKYLQHPLPASVVYLLMKPAEWLFLAVLYLCDRQPEIRINRMYR